MESKTQQLEVTLLQNLPEILSEFNHILQNYGISGSIVEIKTNHVSNTFADDIQSIEIKVKLSSNMPADDSQNQEEQLFLTAIMEKQNLLPENVILDIDKKIDTTRFRGFVEDRPVTEAAGEEIKHLPYKSKIPLQDIRQAVRNVLSK